MDLNKVEDQLLRLHYQKRWWMPLTTEMLAREVFELVRDYPDLEIDSIRSEVVFKYANATFVLQHQVYQSEVDFDDFESGITAVELQDLLAAKPNK